MSAKIAQESTKIECIKLDCSDWKLVSFGDVALKQNESVDREKTKLTRYVAGKHMGSENLHLREWGELSENYIGPTFTRKFIEGDILYGSRRTYLSKVAVAHFNGITSNTTFVIKPNEELILKELLPFVMLSEGFAQHSIRNSNDSVNTYINWKDIASYEFLLPPKDQQAKLAELLWAADTMVQKLSETHEKIAMARNCCFRETVKLQPGSMSSLSDVIKPKRTKSKPPHELEKYVGLEHIKSGEYACTAFADSATIVSQCNIISEGDLCYSKLNPNLDKVFIADFDGISTNELIVFRSINESVAIEYVLDVMHSDEFIRQMTSKGFGTIMPRVSITDIGAYPIKILSKEVQSDLMNRLEFFNDCLSAARLKQNRIDSLLKSLINQIF